MATKLQEAGTRAGEGLLPRIARLRKRSATRVCAGSNCCPVTRSGRTRTSPWAWRRPRGAPPQPERLAAMAADVVRRAPDVECLVTHGLG
jgi:hypothetical protein